MLPRIPSVPFFRSPAYSTYLPSAGRCPMTGLGGAKDTGPRGAVVEGVGAGGAAGKGEGAASLAMEGTVGFCSTAETAATGAGAGAGEWADEGAAGAEEGGLAEAGAGAGAGAAFLAFSLLSSNLNVAGGTGGIAAANSGLAVELVPVVGF
jgi:hypothetical protein